MKSKVFILLATFSLCLSWLTAQTSYIREIPLQLPGNYLYDPHYTPKQIYPCPDGGVIVLGDCEAHYGEMPDLGTAADCGAIKLDSLGNCEWQWWSRDFIGWWDPRIVGIDQEADGRVNFLINNSPWGNQLGWIEPDGTYSISSIELVSCVINRAMRLPNGDIFAIGLVEWTPVISAAFLHLSPQGDTLSVKAYPPDSLWITPYDWYSEAYDMELDTDGMPVATCLFTDRGASVVKTDWDGNIIWRRDTNSEIYPQPTPITKLSDSGELVFGCQVIVNDLHNKYSIYKIGASEIDSLFTIQMTDAHCVGTYYSMIGHNQNIFLSGFFNEQIRIADYSLGGQNIWNWSAVSTLNFHQLTECISVLPDGSIMHVFGNDNFGDYGLNIIKLLPNGTDIEDDNYSSQTFKVKIFPNPMKEMTSIELVSEFINKEAKKPIKLYNLKGQLIRTIELSSKSPKLMTACWDGRDANNQPVAIGCYFLRCELDGIKYTKKIMLLK